MCPTLVARFASISHNYFMSDGLIVYFALSVMLILRDIYFNNDICSFCLPSENTTWTCTVCLFLNHEALEVCEMCEMPRNRAVEATAWIDLERTNHGLAHFDRIKVSMLELHDKLWTIQHKRRLLKNFKGVGTVVIVVNNNLPSLISSLFFFDARATPQVRIYLIIFLLWKGL